MKQIDALRTASVGEKFKFLFKDSFLYGSVGAVTKFLGLFLTPILSRTLTQEEFGSMDALLPLATILLTFVIFGMDGAVARYFYEFKDEEKRTVVVSNGFFWQIAVVLIAVSFAIIFREEILLLYLNDSDLSEVFIILLLSVLFSTPFRFFINLLKWLFEKKGFLIISIGNIILTFFLTVIFVVKLNMGIKGVFLAQTISGLIFSIFGYYFCRNYISFKFNKSILYQMLVYGAPLMFVAMLPALIPSLERYYINLYLGINFIAFYGIGSRIASALNFPIQSYLTAAGPFLYALHKEKDIKFTYHSLIILFSSGLIFSSIIIASFSQILFSLLAPESYKDGLIVVIPILCALTFEALSTVCGIGLSLSKKTYLTAIIHVVVLAINLTTLYFLTPLLGLVGIGISLAISKLLMLFLNTIIGRKVYPLKFHIKPVVIILFSGIVLLILLDFIIYTKYLIFAGLFFSIIFLLIIYSFALDERLKVKAKNILFKIIKKTRQ